MSPLQRSFATLRSQFAGIFFCMQTYTDYTEFEDTRPAVARWDHDVSADGLWIWRCAMRMVEIRREIDLDQAYDLAQELSLDDQRRARLPEHVAEDMVRDHRWLS